MEVFRPSLKVGALEGGASVPRLLAALRARRDLVCLDSAAGAPRRFSLVAFDPLPAEPARDLRGVRRMLRQLDPRAGDEPPGPFAGGFLGALAYDLGIEAEAQRLPPAPWRTPPVLGGLYTDFVVVLHGADGEPREAVLVLGEAPGDGRPSVAARRRSIEASLAGAAARAPEDCFGPVRAVGPLRRCVAPEEHMRRIEDLRARIGRGELYQANLAHRFERDVRAAPEVLYLRLREVNAAPYMGFVRQGELALLSSSPELLLELDGARARTRPIKGTSPRSRDPREDARSKAGLAASRKDRAELAMIVDLERNDLARIAEPGTVRVEAFPEVESYASVHHLVADVTARPRDGCDAVDVLAALFPGGSITGAPKVAAMEAIGALEGEGRGFFTGSLGYFDVRGRAAWNVLIRTLVRRARPGGGALGEGAAPSDLGTVTFHVGGGITYRSDPAAEERETCVKGAALALALSDGAAEADTLGEVVVAPGGGAPAPAAPGAASVEGPSGDAAR